jgi:plastocyanin domain-containing protein
MKNKKAIASSIASLGMVLGIASGEAVAQMSHSMDRMQPYISDRTGQFQLIEQPLRNKIIVTVGGLGLIGLELWWFLLSKPKSANAIADDGKTKVKQ